MCGVLMVVSQGWPPMLGQAPPLWGKIGACVVVNTPTQKFVGFLWRACFAPLCYRRHNYYQQYEPRGTDEGPAEGFEAKPNLVVQHPADERGREDQQESNDYSKHAA